MYSYFDTKYIIYIKYYYKPPGTSSYNA